jgi:hypothetical protein
MGVVSDRDCRYALNSPYIMRDKWQDEARRHAANPRCDDPCSIIIEPNAQHPKLPV